MSKVVYLLGAGASYGKRNMDEPVNSPKRIMEGLPVVNEICDELDVVINELKNVNTNKNIKYTLRGQEHSYASMINELVEGLGWLRDQASNHATIDTYAKKLHLKGNIDDYGKLKFFLTTFFLIEQSIHKIDKRYDTFYANILDKNSNIPDDVYIMTWNYDNQLDIAYRDYKNEPLPVLDPKEKNSEVKQTKVFKINGSANYYNVNRIDASIHFKDDLDTLLNRICNQICIANNYSRSWSGGTNDLMFAWENDAFEKYKEHLFGNILDTRVLVIIGYTFPFFNREIDREIFLNMPNLEQIYIQDPCAESVKDSLYSVLTDKQRERIYTSIKLIKSTTNFFLPHEL